MEGVQEAENKAEVEEIRKERKLVLPGDELGIGRAGRGAYYDHESGKVFSKLVGLADSKGDLHFVIPLNGVYDPKRGDGVVGRIIDITFSKWIVNVNAPYEAVLPLNEAVEEFVDFTKTDLTRFFDYNDLIFAEVSTVTNSKSVQLSMKDRKCRKLRGGRLVSITPAKVPRIIGRGGSMVEMIKNKTGTQIVVGQNGIVWVKGEKQTVAIEAIMEIEERSQMSGLTDFISKMLDEKLGIPAEESVNKEEDLEKKIKLKK